MEFLPFRISHVPTSPRLLPAHQEAICHHNTRDPHLHKEDSGYPNVPACLKGDGGKKDGEPARLIEDPLKRNKDWKLFGHASQILSFLSTLRGYD